MSMLVAAPQNSNMSYASRAHAAEALLGLCAASESSSAPATAETSSAPASSTMGMALGANAGTALYTLPQSMLPPQIPAADFPHSAPDWRLSAQRYALPPAPEGVPMPPIHSGLLRSDSLLLSQLNSHGGIGALSSWHSLVHPGGRDILANQPTNISPTTVHAPIQQLAPSTPQHTTLPASAPAPSGSTPPSAKRRRSGKGDAKAFSWVILQAPPSKAEQAAGLTAASTAPGEKPLKKLRGHAGYSWKPL